MFAFEKKTLVCLLLSERSCCQKVCCTLMKCCLLQVGSTVSGRPGFEDDAKTLRDLKFEIGDLLDVAVFV